MPVDCVQKEVVNLNEYSYIEFIARVDRRIIRLQQEHRQYQLRRQERLEHRQRQIKDAIELAEGIITFKIYNNRIWPREALQIRNNYREHIRVISPENLDFLNSLYRERENSKSYLYRLLEEIIIICQNIFNPRR